MYSSSSSQNIFIYEGIFAAITSMIIEGLSTKLPPLASIVMFPAVG